LKFYTHSSLSERSPTQMATHTFPKKSSSSLSFVNPINEPCELPSGDIMATSSSSPIKILPDKPVVIQDRWLGFQLLEFVIANVIRGSISPHASLEEFQDLQNSRRDNFRYEECYVALCGPNESPQPDANFCDLLLGQIGHISCQDKSHDLTTLCMVLEKHVDNPRQHQRNEKFILQENSNAGHTPKAKTLLSPPPSPIPPLQTNTRIISSQAGENVLPLPKYTTMVEEHCKAKGLDLPVYTTEETQFSPARFVSTVTFGDLEARGKECSSKKTARHEASYALWNLLLSTNNS